MTAPDTRRRSRFLIGFLLAALVIAGGVSYLASSSPDGLDSVTLHGCQVTETATGEQLDGACIAQNATEHPAATGPLADYSIGGAEHSVGLAGIIGVIVTVLAAGGLFWLLRGRRGPAAGDGPGDDGAHDHG
ncbi:PDGLE domain-containing protein [Pseudonocardia sp. N23]|uniref:PDGLE domain-containing protein n=1 Tax=Pseudonocardia sp. N23 TaxID=1987376 RepID=UPI000BFBF891|nr:PDGLE domain-containing protein [Pseudonocardia sp. N23]GAY10676.1 additional substrate-specific component NikN of nickel ECF transporter [Pseudonocardia sp. N23]